MAEFTAGLSQNSFTFDLNFNFGTTNVMTAKSENYIESEPQDIFILLNESDFLLLNNSSLLLLAN